MRRPVRPAKPAGPAKATVNGQERAEQLIKAAKKDASPFLDLGNLGLMDIPRSLMGLKDQLEVLVLGKRYYMGSDTYVRSSNSLGENFITDLGLLSAFPRLQELYLFDQHVRSLEPLRTLNALEHLDLAHAGIYDLEGIQDLIGLRVLELESNNLTSVEKLAKLSRLHTLDLSRNFLSKLDVFVRNRFPKLSILDLSGNEAIVHELRKIKQLGGLDSLFLKRIRLSNVETLAGFKEVKHLMLQHNQIEDASAFQMFPGLITLNVSDNLIKDMRSIQDHKKLKKLSIDDNKIKDLGFLKNLIGLEKLSLARNQVSDIRPLAGLTRLTFLELSDNSISDLDALQGLEELDILVLSKNEIGDIKPVSALPKLRVLELSDNRITDLSPIRSLLQRTDPPVEVYSINRFTHTYSEDLLKVYLYGNPIADPPVQYLKAGATAILSYWEQRDKLVAEELPKILVNEAKLIIVGNSHVGKTTLAYLLQHGRLPEKQLASTHGMEFSTWKPGWEVGGTELTINVIDFGGQEYYHDAHYLFFQEKAVFLLLWEPWSNENALKETPVGQRDELEIIRHFKVEYWLNAISLYARENDLAPVLLVQTFMDKYGRKFLDMEELQQRYHRIAGAMSIGLDRPVSRELESLHLLMRSAFEEITEQFGQSYDARWVAIREHIVQAEKERYRIMNISSFREYFLEHAAPGLAGRYSEEDIRTMCITLNHWGVVLYRYEPRELRDIVILNPPYFTRQVNRLLTDTLRGRPQGIFKNEVAKILGVDRQSAGAFIQVLLSFKMLFELPRAKSTDEPAYISPMYLEDKPPHVGLFLEQFVTYYKIRYKGFFHKGILLECFSALGQELLHRGGMYFCWRWGMVLKRGARVVSIEFDDVHLDQVLIRTIRKDKELLGRDPFLQDIFKAFEHINRHYKVAIGLSYDGVDFIDKKMLLARRDAGLNKFDHKGRRFDVRDLAFLLLPEDQGLPSKRVFVSYSSGDRKALDVLEAHLRAYKTAGVISYWNDLFIDGRAGWDEQIKAEMENANILLMLISPDYLGTEYIVREEIALALRYQQAAAPAKQVFWVLLRPCDYEAFPDIARHPIFPLKESDASGDRARHRALSEYENEDREWVKLLKRFLDEE